jgi:ubiquinone/menaquinone biosynthesis C-methylase UbiE
MSYYKIVPMGFSKGVSKQLHHPSGWIGRFILPRIWNRRNAALNEVTLEDLDLQSDDCVLEIGCGGGFLISRMAEVIDRGRITGVDSSKSMVDYNRRRFGRMIGNGKLEIDHAPAEALPYPDSHFTKACTVNTIFYFKNILNVFSELYRVLRTGGLLAVCFTNRKDLENKAFVRQGFMLYDADEAARLLKSAGFYEIRTRRDSDRWREFICMVCKKP